MQTVLLTGATGALGSQLLPGLLARGDAVICLVRGNDQRHVQQRIDSIIGPHERLRVIRGDITEPQCGISSLNREQLMSRGITRIIHSAASINFQNRDKTMLTNVGGVQHVLELADLLNVMHVVHVSTTYVAGEAKYLRESDLPSSVTYRPRNVYEESKQIGETMIRAWALAGERFYTVLRPSVLVGRQDGSSPTFDGFYQYFMPIDLAAKSYRGSRDLPEGVQVDAGGIVHMNLAILMANLAVNYVPLDWCAEMIAELQSISPRNSTYHLAHDKPLRMLDGLNWALERLKVRVRIVGTKEEKTAVISEQSAALRKKQRQVDMVHDPYEPYCTTSPFFETTACVNILGSRFRAPPVIDQGYIHRMIEFGQRSGWGLKPKARLQDA